MRDLPAAVPQRSRARWGDFLGLFLVALATLMLEILLTRIFSVTLWYHLAFVAVSIAMFGMTLGAVIVYLGGRWLTGDRAWLTLAASCALFAVASVISVAVHLRTPLDLGGGSALVALSRAYLLIAIPFVFSGIAVAIALTRFPAQVGRLYAADLAGAALGCIALMLVVDRLGGPASVLVVAAIGGAAAIVFACGSAADASRVQRGVAAVIALIVVGGATIQVGRDRSNLQISHAKGERPYPTVYEKWNSHSRVAVWAGDSHEKPFGWGLSSRYGEPTRARQLHLTIDASAETVMTEYVGKLDDVAHLRYDVVNAGLYLRPGARVYVVGAGGGRDVLSALSFGASRVVAVELNRAILDALNGTFGEMTGHLDRDPRVQFVNDEARSYLARSGEKFDFIQISLIDTWAATAAGAFVLSENTLYTREAWQTFLRSLTDTGIVSVSRWYRPSDPSEMYKSTALATMALRDLGITDTRRHLAVIARLYTEVGADAPGVGTLLVSRSPFTEQDVTTLQRLAHDLDFSLLLQPSAAATTEFAAAADARELDALLARSPVDLTPPDDNRPFFFKMDGALLDSLLAFVIAVAAVLIVLPVLLKADARAIAREWRLSIAFLAIGIGFMLVEIALMLRLTTMLGHPTLSLSVVLFGMLLASGAGSATTSGIGIDRLASASRVRSIALLIVLAVIGAIAPLVVTWMHTASTPLRIATALALIVPAGVLMGMMFPMAMTLGAARRETLAPWFWGINGAASVCASVLAVTIASTWGISQAWWTGVACYAFAALAIVTSSRAQ